MAKSFIEQTGQVIHFKETTAHPQLFFEILPVDWQEGIVPFWPAYQHSARIFVLEKNDAVLGGGILFSTVSPDTMAYRNEAQRILDQGYLYIAFLFFPEKYRGQGLGSKWLDGLGELLPQQPFWLSIEEESLQFFYKKNGFKVHKEVAGEYGPELILVKENGSSKIAG